VRIAILNASSRPAGGVGSYLRIVIPALARRGHEIAFWHECGEAPDGDPFALPASSPSWSVEQIGLVRALAELSRWQPQVLVSHGLKDPAVEARTLEIAPAVFHALAYHGTCISGAKTFKNPTNMPCSRRFGWPCLVNYYPRRCGGWSPVTMVREFRLQAQRLELLPRYKALVTFSSHLQREFARHGIEATRVAPPMESALPAASERVPRNFGEQWQLLFVGRMDHLKGGGYFLDALPRVVSTIDRIVKVTFAGDGPARASWQAAAARLATRERKVRIEFSGWLDPHRIEALLATADLLVVPSLWPEPFGLVGLEAARHRLPVAAFAVGGIPDWLRSGVNGYLARGDPPTADGLAEAIIACLKDPETHARLRDGAGRVAAEFDLDDHMDGLMRVLDVARVR
jgi:glycosyltransferase involved in cell wall biosynthesis